MRSAQRVADARRNDQCTPPAADNHADGLHHAIHNLPLMAFAAIVAAIPRVRCWRPGCGDLRECKSVVAPLHLSLRTAVSRVPGGGDDRIGPGRARRRRSRRGAGLALVSRLGTVPAARAMVTTARLPCTRWRPSGSVTGGGSCARFQPTKTVPTQGPPGPRPMPAHGEQLFIRGRARQPRPSCGLQSHPGGPCRGSATSATAAGATCVLSVSADRCSRAGDPVCVDQIVPDS